MFNLTEGTVMNMREGIKAMRRMPLFPLIPLLPAVMVTSCIAMNVATYRRMRRLESRLNESQQLGIGYVPGRGERATAAAPH